MGAILDYGRTALIVHQVVTTEPARHHSAAPPA
jgi:hypothetical protein